MDNSWAQERLDVIRTLMERAALYRRALGPVMIALGLLGLGAAFLGRWFEFNSGRSFTLFWLGVSIIAVAAAFVLVRRQSIVARETFWSPPTRRVAQALLPALTAGAVFATHPLLVGKPLFEPVTLVPLWMFFYGCAVHAAGFFMTRGIKLFGWFFIIAAMGVQAALVTEGGPHSPERAHLLMGVFFGGFHLAYGIYLQSTERRQTQA